MPATSLKNIDADWVMKQVVALTFITTQTRHLLVYIHRDRMQQLIVTVYSQTWFLLRVQFITYFPSVRTTTQPHPWKTQPRTFLAASLSQGRATCECDEMRLWLAERSAFCGYRCNHSSEQKVLTVIWYRLNTNYEMWQPSKAIKLNKAR